MVCHMALWCSMVISFKDLFSFFHWTHLSEGDEVQALMCWGSNGPMVYIIGFALLSFSFILRAFLTLCKKHSEHHLYQHKTDSTSEPTENLNYECLLFYPSWSVYLLACKWVYIGEVGGKGVKGIFWGFALFYNFDHLCKLSEAPDIQGLQIQSTNYLASSSSFQPHFSGVWDGRSPGHRLPALLHAIY